VERRIIETSQRLTDAVDTRVYSGTKAGFKTATSLKGVSIVPCFSTDFVFPMDNWFFNRTLSHAVERISAEVFEVHTVSGYGFVKSLRNKCIRKPVVHTIHGVLADEYAQILHSSFATFRSKLANFMMRQLAEKERETAEEADLIVTVSRYSSEKAVELYEIDSSKMRIVPNGVDIKRFRPLGDLSEFKRQIGVDDRPCVLFVGRLIPRKGLGYLIEAAKHVVKEFENTVFVIVGNGPLRGHLVNYIDRSDLSGNFVFLGDVNEEVLPLLYNCADVFVLPSIQEGQGIALLEAQSTAKPVVAFRVGGVPEALLEGQSGLLGDPGSYELSQSLLRLLADSSLREGMGKRGREFVAENFSWEVCTQKMFEVYGEAKSLFA